MENRVTVGTMVALACSAALALAAQRPQPGEESKETFTATVTGCVQPGAGPKTFVLAESPSALIPPGAAAQPAQARDRGTRYELLPDDTIDLSKLVGRQVEASGTVSKPAVSSNKPKGTTKGDALPKFILKSIRETGASC
jgi:hypothetical protein